MIVDLPNTTTTDVSKRLVRLRENTGSMALGRVLTLITVADEDCADHALEVAGQATRQHPSRIVCVIAGTKRGKTRLDAQIRLGGDAGASEMVVMRLYGQLAGHPQSVVTPFLLPDSPVVAWWPSEAPSSVAEDPIGAMAQRRITDAATAKNPHQALVKRAATYVGGDTDLAWGRITRWRGLLASALDQPPHEPVTVVGASDSPSADLLVGWLSLTLGASATLARTDGGSGVLGVRLERDSGPIDLLRPEGDTATMLAPQQPARLISLAHRTDAECLAEELRRLDPDDVYGESLTRGLKKVSKATSLSAKEAADLGLTLSRDDAIRAMREAAKSIKHDHHAEMVDGADA
ncbi:glucose-6-phosphate dehydrogenase assembly protein OpcA [Kribbia dieselivorans]|uniref:glucose-6-phosphate dehydrogenase assembly protein OpcA n=1 Tax=Kribbia dieselivorans TaxID=331526 RepID=UPI0009FAEBC3|nr:glucose-6-phosphate dehydrogenase assembly protein OpcA [Kribbia dieselivorans]